MLPKVLGLGDNTVDTYVDLGRQYPGGNAVNVAVLAKWLGADAAYIGCLGNDATGALLRTALTAEGIDISHARAVDAPNARAFIRHNSGDRQFVRSEPGCRGAWGAFSAADLEYIQTFDCVHSSFFSGLEPHRATLRPAISFWSFDFSEKWTPENLADWLPHLDAVFLSYPSGSDDECAALAASCRANGPNSVVITRGAKGAFASRGDAQAFVTPQPVAVVDTLGAGDAFIAAYLLATRKNEPLPATLQAAAAAAADACGRFGAFGHGSAWHETETRKVS